MTPQEIREQRERYRDRAVALRLAALEVHHQGALDIANGIRSEMAIALSPLGGRCRPLREVDELLTRYEAAVQEAR